MIFSRIRAALAAWDMILLAVALTVAGFLVWPGWLSEAREAGALSERLAWMEKQRRADIRRDEERVLAQARIDAAERAMINGMADAAIRAQDLETALAEERKNAANDDAGGAAACPAMPERVRDALNRIGR